MENLMATYQDDDEEENAATAAPPPTFQDPPPTFQDPPANAESPPSASDDVIVEPVLATELPDTDQKSPSKSTDEDDDDDDEEEEEEEVEEPPVKKQKPLSSLTLTPPKVKEEEQEQEQGEEMTKLTSSKAKSKKKNKGKNNMNNLWTKPNSRKGKKKNNGISQKSKKNGAVEAAAAAAEDKVYITPVPRFPDKNDDTPESKICLSKVYKAEKVDVSEDRLSAGSTKGYRMVRATRGVLEGAWYFEINVVKLGETGHTRLGWSIDKGDLQAPVGYDANSFGYRDIDGSKIHKALREKYGEQGYREGDVIGFYINLPEGQQYTPKPPRLVWYKGQRYICASDPKEDPPKIIPGSEISFFKNGVCQGVAFKDLFGGRYYPAASMYTLPDQPNCVVRFNFGPDFECFPEDFTGRPMPKPMVEVPFHGFEGRVENGNQWHSTRICPMLKVVKEHENKIGEAAEMAS